MSKHQIPALMFFLVCLVWSTPNAYGQLYQYKDANGTVHFTDDYGTIPREYRPAVTVIQESGAGTGNRAADKAADDGKDSVGSTETPQLTAEDIARFEEERAALAKEKALLEEKGRALDAEKNALEAAKRKILESNKVRNNRTDRRTKETLTEIGQKLADLGSRVKQHNKDIQEFNKKAEAFDSRMNQAGGKPAQ